MNPILFESTAKSFNNNGIGILSDAAFCEVTEERNGIFELVLNYPVSGLHFNKIEHRSIILAKPNATANPQPFRVYSITKPMSGMITVYAQHISYDLSGTAVRPFEAGSAAAALQALKTNSVGENPFEFWTDKSTVATMNVKTPASVRAMLGGVAGSVLDTYGGEYEWDGFTVKLYNKRGQNRGVSVRYGKNLIDLTQEENCSGVYTDVLPFWADSEGNSVMLDEETVSVEGNFDFVRVFVLDLSSEFENQPTKEELKSYTEKYIKNNKIGVPHISINLSFVQLEQTEEYKNKALLERVNLCDEVNVVFEKLGVSATAQVVKTVYNVLLNRYESVELGDAKSNFAETFVKQEQAIKDAPKQAISMAAKAAENATQLITGNRGGYVVIHSSTGQTQPDEILIMDKPTIEEAVKVWRWNNSGLGYSEKGYAGPYVSAWTIDGVFNADFITAGTLSANLIKTGLLQSINERTSFDMDDGKIRISMNDDIYMVMDSDGIVFYQYDKIVGRLSDYCVNSSYANFNQMNIKSIGDQDEDKNILRIGLTSEGANIDISDKNEETKTVLGATTYGGSLRFYKRIGENTLGAIGSFKSDDNSGSVLEICDSNCITTAQLKNKQGSGGQLELRNEKGVATFSFSNASGGGAECWIGQGNGVYKLFDYNGGINLYVDHVKYYGKNEGLFVRIGSSSTSSANSDEYSAFLVCGVPASGRRQSTIVIPSSREGNYQIADEDYYLDISYEGNAISKSGGSSGAAIQAIYGIR